MTADEMARLPQRPVAEEDREGVQVSAGKVNLSRYLFADFQ
jgi:hypothetical protein